MFKVTSRNTMSHVPFVTSTKQTFVEQYFLLLFKIWPSHNSKSILDPKADSPHIFPRCTYQLSLMNTWFHPAP